MKKLLLILPILFLAWHCPAPAPYISNTSGIGTNTTIYSLQVTNVTGSPLALFIWPPGASNSIVVTNDTSQGNGPFIEFGQVGTANQSYPGGLLWWGYNLPSSGDPMAWINNFPYHNQDTSDNELGFFSQGSICIKPGQNQGGIGASYLSDRAVQIGGPVDYRDYLLLASDHAANNGFGTINNVTSVNPTNTRGWATPIIAHVLYGSGTATAAATTMTPGIFAWAGDTNGSVNWLFYSNISETIASPYTNWNIAYSTPDVSIGVGPTNRGIAINGGSLEVGTGPNGGVGSGLDVYNTTIGSQPMSMSNAVSSSGGGVQIFTPILGSAYPLKPGWVLHGTAITAIAVQFP